MPAGYGSTGGCAVREPADDAGTAGILKLVGTRAFDNDTDDDLAGSSAMKLYDGLSLALSMCFFPE
jgi:hypothetical protein